MVSGVGFQVSEKPNTGTYSPLNEIPHNWSFFANHKDTSRAGSWPDT
jgi:hypothetical protein